MDPSAFQSQLFKSQALQFVLTVPPVSHRDKGKLQVSGSNYSEVEMRQWKEKEHPKTRLLRSLFVTSGTPCAPAVYVRS
jgi:hypothetical protein